MRAPADLPQPLLPAEVGARRSREHRAPVVGPPGTDPPPLRPRGVDALDSIAFATASTAIAIATTALPVEITPAPLWASGCLAALAAIPIPPPRQRWLWIPVGIAGTAAAAATAAAMVRLWAALS